MPNASSWSGLPERPKPIAVSLKPIRPGSSGSGGAPLIPVSVAASPEALRHHCQRLVEPTDQSPRTVPGQFW
jgi:hypothetical protein